MAESGPVRERHENTHGVAWKRMVVWGLALGVVTNVVVAVGAAFMFPDGPGRCGVDDWHWKVWEGTGRTIYDYSTRAPLTETPERMFTELIKTGMSQQYRSDKELFAQSENLPPMQVHDFVIEFWGFPFRMCWGWRYSGVIRKVSPADYKGFPAPNGQTTKTGGGNLIPVLIRSYKGSRILPFYPSWLGLLANVTIFSAMWLTVLRGVRVWRRVLRNRKGVCVACRYDLRGSVSGMCPECGDGQAGVWG